MNTGWRTGSADPAETANTQPRLRKRAPLRWREHRKALILPGCVLAILGGSLTVRALISDNAAPVSTALEQAAAAPPVRPAEPVSASARVAAQPSRPAQTPDPIPPAQVAAAPTPAPPLPSTILAPPDSSSLGTTPRPMGLQPDPAVALAPTTPAPRVMALAPMRQPAPAAAPAPVATPAPAKDKPAREPKPAKVEPAAAAQPESASIERDGGSYTLVLATVGSRQAADAELRKLIQKHPGVLSGKLTYSRVKDDVWQVRTKGLSEDQAQSVCTKIEAAGGSCTARSSE